MLNVNAAFQNNREADPLAGISSKVIHYSLDKITAALDTAGNPHNSFKSIHIAGTNGKGSITQYMTNILIEAGFKVGTYTSPHLISVYERIKVNNGNISAERFEEIVAQYRNTLEGLSYFEAATFIAFVFFGEQHVDFAVIEAGLGGRLDATNVITPEISIISSISKEHTAFLGNTLSAIAREKAGIIKDNGITVIGKMDYHAKAAIADVAAAGNNSFYDASETVHNKVDIQNIETWSVELTGIASDYRLNPKMIGPWQVRNISAALLAAELLGIKKKDIVNGIEKTIFPGRFTILRRNPYLIFDGAHTPDSAKRLIKFWFEFIPKTETVIICGFLKDKDFGKMLSFIPKDVETYFIPVPNERSWERDDFIDDNALHELLASRRKNILVFGSLYLYQKIAGVVRFA